MPTEEKWLQAFRRLERGSSLRQEAAKLGTSKSTVERRYQSYLEQQTKKLRSSLTGLMSEISKAEKGLAGLGQEYTYKEQQELAKLRARIQTEEAKLQGDLMRQEREGAATREDKR